MSVINRLTGLFGRRRFAIRPGTERIASLLARHGNPEKSFKTIHIAGTNGKGSTAAFLAAILTASGYCTGLFSSPHLVRYNERFRVNGSDISSFQLDGLLSRILDSAEPEETFFELTTAMACCHFADCGVQIAVMEAGMGGRNDATAAIPGFATILTPVSLDHCNWLGETVEAIAKEKAGIAKPGSTVISARQEPEALDVIKDYCRCNGNRLLLEGVDFQAARAENGIISYRSSKLSLDGLESGLAGSYQTGNAASAIAAAEFLMDQGLSVSCESIAEGVKNVRWPGRMELFRLPCGADLMLDGAHNSAGADALCSSIAKDFRNRRIILLLGLMDDKDAGGILPPLLRHTETVITVSPQQDRAMPDRQLAELCMKSGHTAIPAGSVANGLKVAEQIASPGDMILVAGSLFTVGEVRALLEDIICEAVRG